MKSFLSRFGSLIRFCLSGFDRIRLRGDSRRLNNARGVDSYLYCKGVRYVDYPDFAKNLTENLCQATEKQALTEDVPLKHLNSPTLDKEEAALQLAQAHARTSGRIALITSVELCDTYRLRKVGEKGWVKPVKERGKCLHYYHYFLHQDLGLCYVRVQSWFPFSIRVGLNGRQWLYRQLDQRGVSFTRRNNLLLSVAQPTLAQELLDEQCRADWRTLLDKLVRPVHPLWSELQQTGDTPYWTAEQTEWATDFVFRNRADLALWYPRWIRQGIETFSCRDVLRYLGKKVPAESYGHLGEVKIDLRERVEGTRLKYWYAGNASKFYDKEGWAMRLETIINSPKGFRVFRHLEGAHPKDAKEWLPLRKGVADMKRRAEVSHACNQRLAEGLATVAEPEQLGNVLKPLGQPVVKNGRRHARALNPLTGADGELLRCIAQGKYLIEDFRNQDVRQYLYGDSKDAEQRRRQAAATTRKLTLLRAHGIIKKVPKSHKYRLTVAGRRIVTAVLAAHACDINRLTQSA